MVTYKVRFDEHRCAIAENHYSQESPARTWKHAQVCDEIWIRASGRNIASKPFNCNVLYTVYDLLIPVHYRKEGIKVQVLFDPDGSPSSIATNKILAMRRTPRSSRPVQELVDAVIAADEFYARPGGQVLYKHERRIDGNQHLRDELAAWFKKSPQAPH